MARRTPQSLTPRWRRRVWNASEPPFSYELAVFYVLAHVPYFICLWIIFNAFPYDMIVYAAGTAEVIREMMFWLRTSAWLMFTWTIALGVSASIPWQGRTRKRLPIIALAVLISWLLVDVAHQASAMAERRAYPEDFGELDFRYDPASQKWFYQP
jgi:hypothetical protein